MARGERQGRGGQSLSGAQHFPNLLTPLRIGPTTVRNRVLVSAHQPGLAENGLPADRYIEYHRTLAADGPGLQVTGATPVHPTGTSELHCLANFDDRIIPGYRKLADAVHAEGGRILAQLAHFGALGVSSLSERPLWAPSPVASEFVRETPHQMTKGEIEEVVEAFGEAARRVREGGLDGIEITAAHGLLIAAFLSPHSNHRADEYGGSLDNRLRFLLEVLDTVRKKAGQDLLIGVRIAAEEKVKGGVDLPHAQQIASRLEATGKVHYLSVISGTNLDRFQRWAHWPATPAPHGLFVHLARGIKEAVDLPVFAVGRITDPAHAEKILAEGSADMVGMTRAHIADPHLVAKVRQGRPEDIRPCVGANVCIKRLLEGLAVHCMHNPETGRAAEWGPPTPTRRPKHVVVIGAGPAGMEAARVAALRGHSVELFERQQALGGQLRLWAAAPAMSELREIIDWQERQLEKLGVKVHTNRDMMADEVISTEADVAIVATGSLPLTLDSQPRTADLSGVGDCTLAIATPQEVLEGKVGKVRKTIVWDHAGEMAGSQIALSAAERLAETGAEVWVVTPNFAVGEDIHPTTRIPLYQRLLSSGMVFTPNSEVSAVEGTNVIIREIYSGKEQRASRVDALVAWLGNQAQDNLWHALSGRLQEVYAAGDCLAPRSVEAATTEGAKIARTI